MDKIITAFTYLRAYDESMVVRKETDITTDLINKVKDRIKQADCVEYDVWYFSRTKTLFDAFRSNFPLGTDNNDKVQFVFTPVYGREKLLGDAAHNGDWLLSEALELSTEFLTKINGGGGSLTTTDFSLEAIVLFQHINLYYEIGKNLNDYTSTSDILYTGYKQANFKVYGMQFGINPGNILISDVFMSQLEAGKPGEVKSTERLALSSDVSYSFLSGIPKDNICNVLESQTAYKPDVIYVVLMTYRIDINGNQFAPFEKSVIDSFTAAIDYFNENVYLYYYLYNRNLFLINK